MTIATSLLQIVGQTPTDRWVIAAAWTGLVLLAAVIFIVAAARPRARR